MLLHADWSIQEPSDASERSACQLVWSREYWRGQHWHHSCTQDTDILSHTVLGLPTQDWCFKWVFVSHVKSRENWRGLPWHHSNFKIQTYSYIQNLVYQHRADVSSESLVRHVRSRENWRGLPWHHSHLKIQTYTLTYRPWSSNTGLMFKCGLMYKYVIVSHVIL